MKKNTEKKGVKMNDSIAKLRYTQQAFMDDPLYFLSSLEELSYQAKNRKQLAEWLGTNTAYVSKFLKYKHWNEKQKTIVKANKNKMLFADWRELLEATREEDTTPLDNALVNKFGEQKQERTQPVTIMKQEKTNNKVTKLTLVKKENQKHERTQPVTIDTVGKTTGNYYFDNGINEGETLAERTQQVTGIREVKNNEDANKNKHENTEQMLSLRTQHVTGQKKYDDDNKKDIEESLREDVEIKQITQEVTNMGDVLRITKTEQKARKTEAEEWAEFWGKVKTRKLGSATVGLWATGGLVIGLFGYITYQHTSALVVQGYEQSEALAQAVGIEVLLDWAIWASAAAGLGIARRMSLRAFALCLFVVSTLTVGLYKYSSARSSLEQNAQDTAQVARLDAAIAALKNEAQESAAAAAEAGEKFVTAKKQHLDNARKANAELVALVKQAGKGSALGTMEGWAVQTRAVAQAVTMFLLQLGALLVMFFFARQLRAR